MVRAVLPTLAAELAAELHDLEERGRLRACPEMEGTNRTGPAMAGQRLLSFCSNDYLGLAGHPALRLAAERSMGASGFGASASRLVSGDFPEHRELEAALASFTAAPAALLFPTGYQANLGVVTALAQRGDVILSDADNHASLIDGCRLSRAEIHRYPHGDVVALAEALRSTSRPAAPCPAGARPPRRLIVTESLFSMQGDVAPLAEIAALAAEHRALLIVDEAHALGVMGPDGRGLCRDADVTPDALVGTLGKAFGAFGGFVAGTPELRQLLVNRARTFIFTTAPPPSVAAAAHAALALIVAVEGSQRRRALFDRIDQLRSLLALPAARGTPIVPIILGSDRAAISASQSLRSQAIFVQAIRPPTVAEGTARLRLTLSADHTAADVEALAAAVRPFLR
jgi:8-amino-7-oxononanoate synthase